MRIGIGYDIHKLVEKRDLILGGVKIPYELGLLGHSDADVLIHAIIDSMLGAVALRDIGFHFPDTDERFKDTNSMDLLKETKKLIQKEGYKIGNIDSNIICQKPKLMSYIEENNPKEIFERRPLENIAQDGQLNAYKHSGFWRPMDTLRDKLDLEEMWCGGNAPWKVWERQNAFVGMVGKI